MNAAQPCLSDVANSPLPQVALANLLDLPPQPGVQAKVEAGPVSNQRPPANVAETGAGLAPLEPWRLPVAVLPFLARTLRSRWDSYCDRLRDCREHFSEETVHELRVATRRLMAQLLMAGCAVPGTAAAKAHRLLKRRLKALSQLRDTQVQRLYIERHLLRFPELILWRASLQRRERRLERSAAVQVRGFKLRKLEQSLAGLADALTQGAAGARSSDRMAAAITRATRRAFIEVSRRRRAIDPAIPGTIHRTRLAFKRFRYMAESLSPDFTGLDRGDLRRLARYQRRMGALQDLEVTHHGLKAYMEKKRGRETLLQPFNRYLQQSRARALRSFLNFADELFAFWPPAHVKPLPLQRAADALPEQA